MYNRVDKHVKFIPILNGRHCARFVKFDYGDSINYFVIIPRQAVLDFMRRSLPWIETKRWTEHPVFVLAFEDQLIHHWSYNGPGSWFWDQAGIYKKTKKYITLYQHGGYDI